MESSWGAGKRTMDLDTDSKWLNTVWPQLSHLQNGTINFDSEAVEGRKSASLDL